MKSDFSEYVLSVRSCSCHKSIKYSRFLFPAIVGRTRLELRPLLISEYNT